METLIALLIASAVLLAGLFARSLANARAQAGRERVAARLGALALAGPEVTAQDLVRHQVFSEVPWLNRTLSELDWTRNFDRALRQARMGGTTGAYVLASALCAAAGFIPAQIATGSLLVGFAASAALAPAPLLRVYRRRAKRMEAFQRQLPDALDLIARALKAGNTFSGGMRMVADEFADPIGPEFAATLDEINFGVDTEKALANLLTRVDCPDLKFFVVSVNIQRETGGNLSEIIENTGSLIRERYKLKGRIRVLSAEGRLSAIILLAMPFGIALIIYAINPAYMSLLFTEPIGRMMILSSLVMMTIGAFVIRKMVNFKV